MSSRTYVSRSRFSSSRALVVAVLAVAAVMTVRAREEDAAAASSEQPRCLDIDTSNVEVLREPCKVDQHRLLFHDVTLRSLAISSRAHISPIDSFILTHLPSLFPSLVNNTTHAPRKKGPSTGLQPRQRLHVSPPLCFLFQSSLTHLRSNTSSPAWLAPQPSRETIMAALFL